MVLNSFYFMRSNFKINIKISQTRYLNIDFETASMKSLLILQNQLVPTRKSI
jgi:hypothetical protein